MFTALSSLSRPAYLLNAALCIGEEKGLCSYAEETLHVVYCKSYFSMRNDAK